jgi:2-keto-4-pentenoate hydratase
MDIEHAADALWAGIQRKRHLPPEWMGKLTLQQAYAVQLAILRRRVAEGDAQAGWKVGLTSAAMRAQQGVGEPCFGFLLRSALLRSGARLAFDELIAPGIENELCLTIGEPLRGPNVSVDQARRAIAFVEPALEIAEVRGNFSADMPLSMADNAQQKAFVIGESSPHDSRISLAQAEVSVRFNGEERAVATGAEVMGNPIESVAWLANKLAEHGLSLEAGMRVMSGSFTRQFAVARGDTVTSVFQPFGVVEASFD